MSDNVIIKTERRRREHFWCVRRKRAPETSAQCPWM